jgi:hypothetical protein
MKIAIVTGASSGIGREFVVQIAATEQMDEIWCIARRQDRLVQLKLEVSPKIRPLTLDLLHEENIRLLQELLETEAPEVAVLVNASGFGKYGSYEDLTDYEIDIRDVTAQNGYAALVENKIKERDCFTQPLGHSAPSRHTLNFFLKYKYLFLKYKFLFLLGKVGDREIPVSVYTGRCLSFFTIICRFRSGPAYLLIL